MSQHPDPQFGAVAQASGELARIRAQIEAAGEELAGLQRQIAAEGSRLSDSKAARLVEANEQLVLATLAAQRAAEDSEKAVREMAEAMERDPLTGLPNAAVLRSRLALAIASTTRGEGRIALLLLDLADFRSINDTLGHAQGDEVLRLAARSLAAAVGPAGTVSRHHGNEFLVLLPILSDVSEAAAQAALIVAALGAPTIVNDHVLRLSAHVGISIYPEDGSGADSLIDGAVAAMYRAKWRDRGADAFEKSGGGTEANPQLPTLESLRQPLIAHASATAEFAGRHAFLQEANGQLVLAAIAAQELQDAAEQAQRRQVAILGLVAHEMRNPLGPISSAAALLGGLHTEGPLLSEVRAVIERQVKNLSRLVEDLLDVTRADVGKLKLQMQAVDLHALIDDVVEACRPAMDTRLQKFEVRLPAVALDVLADPGRMTQVFTNLLDNASKYTPRQGTIHLSAAVVDGSTLLVKIADTGIGITPEALSTIFDPFVQEPHATVFNGSGLGIGLTVVRELVEGHGGRITAASPGKGQGSEFSVWLPFARESLPLSAGRPALP